MREWRVGMLLSLIGLFIVAAGPVRGQDTVAAPEAKTVTQTTGPLHVTLTADRTTLGLADRLQLTLTVEAPTGTEVILPEAAEQLGTFTVEGQTSTGPTAIDPQTQRWQQIYTLEASAIGEQVIPPLALSFREAGAAPDTEPTPLQTEPLSVTVTSVLPENADVMAPQDITPPVALTAPRVPLGLWVAAIVVSLALAVGLFWWLQRRAKRPVPPPPPRPAHELALEALQRLQRDNLMEHQAIEPFYVRLSSILRQYIEWRFQLRAPEQTTEEFLADALASGGLIATHRDLLSSFLHQCDLVKFARHQPDRSDMQNAFDHAKVFIEQTADDEVLIAAPAEVTASCN
ncbi:BatD family protein [Candidatus Entotheonella palauensis]|uniref:BatD family protein n=1 Tax=Candidatus Entotheonella palauensis TaxID=93172 RepID=UPI000B7D48E6|nr:BatD family protein [Candidatus Entotheonella palauensis]